MKKLIFNTASRVNEDRDGMDVIYTAIDENGETHNFHVVGSDSAWHFTDQEVNDYAERLFTGLLKYLRQYWQDYKGLPPEKKENGKDFEIYDGDDFPRINEKTSWNGYLLELN